MFLTKERYRDGYLAILDSSRNAATEKASSAPSSILILVAPDVDAICACKMLVNLLMSDCVAHRIRPVTGYAELAKVNKEDVENNRELRAIVLINLGSLIDLSDYFSLDPRMTLHVIDSHRPWNLNNIFDTSEEGQKICVWDDGDIEEDLTEEKAAFEALQYEPEEDSDESDDDDEEAVDDRWRKRRQNGLVDSDEEDEDEEDGPNKRRRLDDDGQPKRLPRKQRQAFEAKVRKYYGSGTYYGQSVAGQLYILAEGLGRVDNDLLWLAIVGLTSQFSSTVIDRERYESFAVIFADEVTRLNVEAPLPLQGITREVRGPTDRSIRVSQELRFMLFRHWNLFDAMFHSSYVAGKLLLWKERGRRNLQGLLAKMGFSIQQCQQTYAHMDMDLKRTLRNKVDSIAPEYGLFDLSFPSFVRAAGYQTVLSASDAVEGIGALLEAAYGVRLDFASDGFKTWSAFQGEVCEIQDKENRHPNPNRNFGNGQARHLGEPEIAPEVADKSDVWWVKNFWTAWKALGADTSDLRNSLQLSMALHRAVIRQGTSTLDKQAIKSLRTFRLVILKEGPDLSVFVHPSSLTRLAFWLVDTVRDLVDKGDVAKRKKGLPLVVACLDEAREVYLVAGINGAAEYGDVRKNRFGLAFQEAAQLSGVESRHDRFDASVAEVRKDDLAAFIEKLHLNS